MYGHLRCPYCGSSRIAFDPERGIYVCTVCGTVVSEASFEEEGPGRLRTENLFGGRRARTHKRYIKIIKLKIKYYNYDMWKTGSLSEEENEWVHIAHTLIEGDPAFKNIRPKSRAALAALIAYLIAGYGRQQSMRKASEATGVPLKTLERLLHKFRPRLTEIEERVVEYWRNMVKELRTHHPSQRRYTFQHTMSS